jgi:hypothetical protein
LWLNPRGVVWKKFCEPSVEYKNGLFILAKGSVSPFYFFVLWRSKCLSAPFFHYSKSDDAGLFKPLAILKILSTETLRSPRSTSEI